MLDPWIIEQIRRREEEQRRREERPHLEIPLHDDPRWQPQKESEGDDKKDPDRGVVIIDFRV